MQPRSIALLLPPAVRAALDARIDATGILPPNMISSMVARIYSDPAARERLHVRALGAMDHLLSDKPGWGNWLNDVGEAIYVGLQKWFPMPPVAFQSMNLVRLRAISGKRKSAGSCVGDAANQR
jgi:hypothetical protein